MIPYSATLGYSTLLDRLSEAAVVELDQLMVQFANEPQAAQQEALMDLLPVLGNQYAEASSLVSAEFFTELQAMHGIRRPVAAETAPPLGNKQWHALAGWGASSRSFEQGGALLVYSLLSGGLTKALTEVSADTIIGNAELQNAASSGIYIGYQRVPRPGCCAWCGMLASRFADYATEASATTVVGRGAPLGSHRLAKGIMPRGSRRAGESFHDYCRCRVVAVTESNAAQMQSDADDYYEAYQEARKKATGKLESDITDWADPDGTRHQTREWVDDEGNTFKSDNRLTKRIAAEMRESMGVK